MINLYYEDITDPRLSFIYSPALQRSTIPEAHFIVHHEIIWDVKDTDSTLQGISTKYINTNKLVLVFIVNDYEGSYRLYRNLVLFRTSMKASKKRKNEFTMPYIWEGGEASFSPAVCNGLPHVGFCGLNGVHRRRLIATFQNAPSVKANFIIREQFWGGSPHDTAIINDFRQNIIENPFIICQRGKGNFSMRFYQTLSFGRIPVLVNTDMSLPFSGEIVWKDFIVFEDSEAACLEKVIGLYNTGQYIDMQKKCHQLFHDYFDTATFFNQMINYIIKSYCSPAIVFPRWRDLLL